MIEQVEGQLGLFVQDTWSGRTSQEHSPATKERTSKPSSRRSSGSQSRKLPMFLCLTGGASGLTADASTMTWADGALLGEYTMRSFGERPNSLTEELSAPALPNGVSASRLSQILEDSAHPKYSLSARACLGILNRAKRRGKALPTELEEALKAQAGLSPSKSELEDQVEEKES